MSNLSSEDIAYLKEKLKNLNERYYTLLERKMANDSLKGYGTSLFAEFLGYTEGGYIHKVVDWRLNKIIMSHKKFHPKEKLIVMINMPRDWGKSTLYNRLFIVKQLIKSPADTFLLDSSKKELAEDMLFPIKRIFEFNPKILKYYGNYKGSVWNKSEITIAPAETIPNPDNVHSIETCGVDSNIASKRYNWIVIDDIVGKENKDDLNYSKQALNHIKLLIPLLKVGGIMLILFMRWGENDLYQQIMDEFKGQYKLIKISDVKRNESGDPINKSGEIVSEDSPERIPLYPEKFPLSVLNQNRMLLGDYMYSCHYAQFPKRTNYKLMDFKMLNKMSKEDYNKLINDITVGLIPREKLICIIDGQETVSEQSNYIGVSFWYYDTQRFVLFDLYKFKLLHHEFAKVIAPIIIKYNIPIVYYEKSGASGNLKFVLRTELNNLGRSDIMLEPVHHKGINKHVRIISMQPYINIGAVWILPEKKFWVDNSKKEVNILAELQAEMDNFPDTSSQAKDDLLDVCFSYTCELFGIDSEFYDPQIFDPKPKKTLEEIYKEIDQERFICNPYNNKNQNSEDKIIEVSSKEFISFL